MIKRKFGLMEGSGSKEWRPEDIQVLLLQCNEKISELNKELKAAQDKNSNLQESLNTKISENEDLRTRVSSLEAKIKDQAESLMVAQSSNDKLRNNNLHLQEENDLLLGRSSNNVSRLINFCELLKTMGIPSVEDCIAIIRDEIVQSSAEMGFEIVDTYEGEFIPEKHTIIDTLFTNDNNLNNHIAKVIRPGVWYKNKCLIPQDVVVYIINQ